MATRSRGGTARGTLALGALAALLGASPVGDDDDADDGRFAMSVPVVCQSIDGFEDYVPRANSDLTKDEKLLLYLRPRHFKTAKVKALHEAHLTQDARIRRKGLKAPIWSRKDLGEYRAKATAPPREIYLRTSISLKALKPGDYELDLTLYDKVGRGAPALRTVPFRVVASAAPAEPEAGGGVEPKAERRP